MICFRCPTCNVVQSVNSSRSGSKVHCQHCSQKIRVATSSSVNIAHSSRQRWSVPVLAGALGFVTILLLVGVSAAIALFVSESRNVPGPSVETTAPATPVQVTSVKPAPAAVKSEDSFADLLDGSAPAADRTEALAALRSFVLGSTLTSQQLRAINTMPVNLEVLAAPQPSLPKDTLQLIKLEKTRLALVEFETMAATDRFLHAAKMTEEERSKVGMKLSWLYGPVTSPLKRDNSKDDLGGMRLVGQLIFADGRKMHAIIPITFYPVREDKEGGGPGLLFAGDNLRIILQLYTTGTVKNDYTFQSFSVEGPSSKKTMTPGMYLNEKTGMLVNKHITTSALGTNCIDCHSNGSNLRPRHYKQMQEKDYQVMEGFGKFLEQAEHLGASKKELDDLKDQMTKDPVSLVPVDELIRANEEQWIRRYPVYKTRLQGEAPPLALPEQSAASSLVHRPFAA
jgi:hypothetical protein